MLSDYCLFNCLHANLQYIFWRENPKYIYPMMHVCDKHSGQWWGGGTLYTVLHCSMMYNGYHTVWDEFHVCGTSHLLPPSVVMDNRWWGDPVYSTSLFNDVQWFIIQYGKNSMCVALCNCLHLLPPSVVMDNRWWGDPVYSTSLFNDVQEEFHVCGTL